MMMSFWIAQLKVVVMISLTCCHGAFFLEVTLPRRISVEVPQSSTERAAL